MITRIETWAYKCLRDVDVRLGRFNVLVGPNASGKSSLLDVIGLLQDALSEKGDVYAAVQKRVTDVRQLIWRESEAYFDIGVEAKLPSEVRAGRSWERLRYLVRIGSGEKGSVQVVEERAYAVREGAPFVERERLLTLFAESPERPPLLEKPQAPDGYDPLLRRTKPGTSQFWAEGGGHWPYAHSPQELALWGVPDDRRKFGLLLWLRDLLLRRVHFLHLQPSEMKKRCPAAIPEQYRREFMPDGKNLPLLVEHLREQEPERFKWWIDHLRTVLPTLTDIDVRRWPEDRSAYLVVRFGDSLDLASWQLSDGTLRLLALTLVAYLPPSPRIFVIEEPENGIHPQAIEAVIQSLKSVYEGQVFIATHSPIVVGLSDPQDLLCFSLDEVGATRVVRGEEHERLRDWLKDVPLGEIFALGILG